MNKAREQLFLISYISWLTRHSTILTYSIGALRKGKDCVAVYLHSIAIAQNSCKIFCTKAFSLGWGSNTAQKFDKKRNSTKSPTKKEELQHLNTVINLAFYRISEPITVKNRLPQAGKNPQYCTKYVYRDDLPSFWWPKFIEITEIQCLKQARNASPQVPMSVPTSPSCSHLIKVYCMVPNWGWERIYPANDVNNLWFARLIGFKL